MTALLLHWHGHRSPSSCSLSTSIFYTEQANGYSQPCSRQSHFQLLCPYKMHKLCLFPHKPVRFLETLCFLDWERVLSSTPIQCSATDKSINCVSMQRLGNHNSVFFLHIGTWAKTACLILIARVQWSRRDQLNAVHIVRDMPLWGVCVHLR